MAPGGSHAFLPSLWNKSGVGSGAAATVVKPGSSAHCSSPGLPTAKVPLSLSRQSLYMVWDTVPVSGELISQMSQEYQGLLSLFFSAESTIISYCYLQLLTWSDPGCPSLVKTSPQNLYTYKQQCTFIFKNGSLLYALVSLDP